MTFKPKRSREKKRQSYQNIRKERLFPSVCCLLASAVIFSACSNTPKLKTASLVYEYGSPVSIKPTDFYDGNPEDCTVDASSMANEAGKEYPATGTYTLPVSINGKSAGSITVEIQDTQPPVFSNGDGPFEIERSAGEVPDFKTLFPASDISEIEYFCNIAPESWSTPGTYTGTITAKDSAGNSVSNPVTLHVLPAANAADVSSDANAADVSSDANTSQNSGNSYADNAETVKDAPGQTDFYADGILVVNKKHPISSTFANGEDLQAYSQVQQLIADAQQLGLNIGNSVSGFRSWQYQENLYQRYCAANGQKAADRFSARPGFSEHQSGLAFDLTHYDGSLVENEQEAQWIAANCAEYGFILRYPEGKEYITGYMAEPWHLRYIGERAKEIMQSGLTLEEYLGVEGGDYLN